MRFEKVATYAWCTILVLSGGCTLVDNLGDPEAPQTQTNDLDIDGDGVNDGDDNCPGVDNPGQLNTDGLQDGGDACDDDDDDDRVEDTADNCPLTPNTNQTNTDGVADGGDACDLDDDNDDILDDGDDSGVIGDGNCPDGVVVACDDNCQLVVNPGQADTDDDGEGDACEGDSDGDGDPDNTDCNDADATVYTGATELCDAIDSDCDGSIVDGFADTDTDGTPDCVDSDFDGDGIANTEDNCVLLVNPLQTNMDLDGLGDWCDYDCDGDGTDEVFVLPNYGCDGDIDLDGDGFRPSEGDCLEGNINVYPGAPELCNGVDDDCDTVADNAVTDCGLGEACIAGVCQAPECTVNADCSDGLFCTGVETCSAGSCVLPNTSPCSVPTGVCDEAGNRCVECTVNADCSPGDTCTVATGTCSSPPPECVVDGDCAIGEFCAGGLCANGQDLNGRTGLGQSGANAGPWADSTADQWDNDGDCFCDLDSVQTAGGMTCLGSTAACPGGRFAGDCDDTPTGFGNNPGVPEYVGDNFDNNCDGTGQ